MWELFCPFLLTIPLASGPLVNVMQSLSMRWRRCRIPGSRNITFAEDLLFGFRNSKLFYISLQTYRLINTRLCVGRHTEMFIILWSRNVLDYEKKMWIKEIKLLRKKTANMISLMICVMNPLNRFQLTLPSTTSANSTIWRVLRLSARPVCYCKDQTIIRC